MQHKRPAQGGIFWGRWYGSNAADYRRTRRYGIYILMGFKGFMDGVVPTFDCIKPQSSDRNSGKVFIFPFLNGELDLTTKPDHRKLYACTCTIRTFYQSFSTLQ